MVVMLAANQAHPPTGNSLLECQRQDQHAANSLQDSDDSAQSTAMHRDTTHSAAIATAAALSSTHDAPAWGILPQKLTLPVLYLMALLQSCPLEK